MNNLKPHILLIDDDDINNFLTEELFHISFPDAQITSMLRATDALEYLENLLADKKDLPDIILVDINMPLVTGWDFVSEFEIISKEFKKPAKLFVYTSSVYFEDINKAKSYPTVTDFITKPITEEMIHTIISSL